MIRDVTLPEVSENIRSATVVKLLVVPGALVTVEQPLLEVETEKAMFELPSPAAGRITEIFVEPGDQVSVGQVLLRVETTEAGAPALAQPPAGDQPPVQEPEARPPEPLPAAPHSPAPAPPLEARGPAADTSLPPVPAAPSVRRLARELGLDIRAVRGTGPKGRISAADVKERARGLIEAKPAPSAGPAARPLPDFSKWGPIRREPLSTVRRITAEAMAFAWSAVPSVTQHDRADVTELESFRRKHGQEVVAAGGMLTVTAILLRVVAEALRRFPRVNSSLDLQRGELILKDHVHLGVAVDTERGLLVPVVRDADRKGITQLAVDLAALSQKARSKKILPEEMEGGTFAISNLGGIGGTGFSPIVYWPQAAILGVARSEMTPVWREGHWAPRLMLPLSLSYDHRIIDGAEGARFLRWVCETLQSPWQLLL